MRGRNNNNRNSNNKGPNPLTKSYESNGPDVKIRGTAQHIAEKYSQLARDAQASGDPVAAENYFQHAEHYYRIIAAAQEQFRDQFGGGYQRPFEEDGDEDGATVNGHPYQGANAGQQGGNDGDPAMQPQPYEVRGESGERGERPQRFERGDRQERERFGNRQDRQERGDRQGRDRFSRGDRQDFQRPDLQQRSEGQHQDPSREPRRERRPEAGDEQPNGLPAFLTTPVRQPINLDEAGNEAATTAEFGGDEAGGEPNGRYGVRNRRRRRSRYGNGQGEEGAAEPSADFAPEGAEPPVE